MIRSVILMNAGVALVTAAVTTGPAAIARPHVPTYSTFQLQARSNLCANESPDVFNLPCSHMFTNGTPVLNESGQVVIRLSVMSSTGRQGVWLGANGSGGIVFQTPVDAFVGDPSLNNAGYAVFSQSLSSQNGLYFYDNANASSGFLTNQPIGTTAWAGVMVNNSGQVGYRANFSGPQAYYSYQPPNSFSQHAAEVSAVPGSPYSFLFTPTFNNNRQIAAHVRLEAAGQTGDSQPDQIRVFNSDGTSVLIAEDVDSNPAAPYTAFDSSAPALMDDGRVAFIATMPGGVRGVFLSDGKTTVTIAQSNSPGVTVIDFFAPAVNGHGLVAFRGRDGTGLMAIFVGNGQTLRRVIGEHDLVPTNLGTGRIDQHDNSVVFGGSVTINSKGDVAFQCALTPENNNQIEWGSGVYIAYADPKPGDTNADGLVNVTDLLAVINGWGRCPAPPTACPADVAPPGGDGVVNVSDLLSVINNWG